MGRVRATFRMACILIAPAFQSSHSSPSIMFSSAIITAMSVGESSPVKWRSVSRQQESQRAKGAAQKNGSYFRATAQSMTNVMLECYNAEYVL